MVDNRDMDRRRGRDRRARDAGPPAGQQERRLILQRRMFNLAARSFAEWLMPGVPAQKAADLGAEILPYLRLN